MRTFTARSVISQAGLSSEYTPSVQSKDESEPFLRPKHAQAPCPSYKEIRESGKAFKASIKTHQNPPGCTRRLWEQRSSSWSRLSGCKAALCAAWAFSFLGPDHTLVEVQCLSFSSTSRWCSCGLYWILHQADSLVDRKLDMFLPEQNKQAEELKEDMETRGIWSYTIMLHMYWQTNRRKHCGESRGQNMTVKDVTTLAATQSPSWIILTLKIIPKRNQSTSFIVAADH